MNCKKCNKENAIKHHVSYDPEKTIWLCKSCHMKEHGRLKKNGTPLCNPNTEGKLISINENVHAELKRLNKKSGISIKRLTEEFIKEGIRKNHEADKIKSEEE